VTTVHIPDDAPPVLRTSPVWEDLAALASPVYHDTLPGSEDGLIERIRDAEIVLNIRSSSKFTARVFESCPKLRLISVLGTGTDHIDLAAAAAHGVQITNTPGVSAI
jgi:phosphoglycerate dehydrogenase-like enzyme